jgi:hypothetical protein
MHAGSLHMNPNVPLWFLAQVLINIVALVYIGWHCGIRLG